MPTWIIWFRWTSIVILLTVAAAKLTTALGSAPILLVNDPLLLASNRAVLLSAGITELMAAMIIEFSPRRATHYLLCTFLGTNFLLYRLARLQIPIETPCPCLGTLGSSLHLNSQYADWMLWGVAAYLALGGFLGLFWLPRSHARIPSLLTSSS